MTWRKHFRCAPSSALLAFASPLVVVIWHLAVLAGRPAHMGALISEVNSVMEYSDVWANTAGTRLLVAQDTETGWGLYFCGLTDRPRKKMIFEQRARQTGY